MNDVLDEATGRLESGGFHAVDESRDGTTSRRRIFKRSRRYVDMGGIRIDWTVILWVFDVDVSQADMTVIHRAMEVVTFRESTGRRVVHTMSMRGAVTLGIIIAPGGADGVADSVRLSGQRGYGEISVLAASLGETKAISSPHLWGAWLDDKAKILSAQVMEPGARITMPIAKGPTIIMGIAYASIIVQFLWIIWWFI